MQMLEMSLFVIGSHRPANTSTMDHTRGAGPPFPESDAMNPMGDGGPSGTRVWDQVMFSMATFQPSTGEDGGLKAWKYLFGTRQTKEMIYLFT